MYMSPIELLEICA